jgi:hypothetical protein
VSATALWIRERFVNARSDPDDPTGQPLQTPYRVLGQREIVLDAELTPTQRHWPVTASAATSIAFNASFPSTEPRHLDDPNARAGICAADEG